MMNAKIARQTVNDRRAARRIPVKLVANVRCQQRTAGVEGAQESVPAPAGSPADFEATMVDLSLNGARLHATQHVPPLLARLEIRFVLPDYGIVDAIGIVMWRRTTHFIVPPKRLGKVMTTSPGFGVLFESIPLGARITIDEMVMRHSGKHAG